MSSGFDAVIDGLSADRLRVQSRAGFAATLPLAHFAEIQRVPGVSHAGYVTVFSSFHGDSTNSVVAAAIGGGVLETKPREFKLASEQAAAFARSRTGAVIGDKLAEKYGWKVGDSVSLTSTRYVNSDGTSTWPFEIVGVYTVEGQRETAQEFYFHYEYLDEGRTMGKGTVSLFVVKADHPAEVAAAIDQKFANSSDPTTTQSDRDWVRSRMKQAGDMNLMVNAMVGASLFTLLFLTGNTMMQSVRERTPEMAVLRTVGFSSNKVAALVAAEAATLCIFGSILGLGGAYLLFGPLSKAMRVPITMQPGVIAAGIAVAVATGIASTLVPCWRAHRLSVVDALAGR